MNNFLHSKMTYLPNLLTTSNTEYRTCNSVEILEVVVYRGDLLEIYMLC